MVTDTCGHYGRIAKDLPCPEPLCAASTPGSALIVPALAETDGGWVFATLRLERLCLIDRRLGAYWRWDLVEGPVNIHA